MKRKRKKKKRFMGKYCCSGTYIGSETYFFIHDPLQRGFQVFLAP